MPHRRHVLLLTVIAAVTVLAILVGFYLGYRTTRQRLFYEEVGPLPGTRRVVLTLLDYFESGRREVDAYVERQPEARRATLSAALDRGRSACVRIRFVLDRGTDGSVHTANATGVIIADGRLVLTAGHALEGTKEAEATLIFVSGATLPARLIEHDYAIFGGAARDWAILEVQNPDGPPPPSLSLGRIDVGDLVLCLGYPSEIGMNAAGRVAYDSHKKSYLEPLVSLARADAISPLELSPVAGSVPLEGMSGAPVLNPAGEVVGIFVSVTTSSRETSVRHYYNAAPVDTLRAPLETWLEERSPDERTPDD